MDSKAGVRGTSNSPCIGCRRNVKLDHGIRKDGKVQCGVDEAGKQLPKDSRGHQTFRLVEPLSANTECLCAGRYAKALIMEAREARMAAMAM